MNKHNLFISNFKLNCESHDRNKRTGSLFVFLCKLFCLSLVLLYFFTKIVMPQYLYEYNAALLDKMERLKTLNGPKIVLIGNSNLSFGIKSELIEDAFDMPVVNMGLHGGLGNAFHEEMAKTNIQEGDIVIIAHTEFDDDDTIKDLPLAWITVENHPDLWKLIRPRDYFDMYCSYPTYIKKACTLWADKSGNTHKDNNVYSRLSFNEYGDISFPRYIGQVDTTIFFTEGSVLVPQISETCTNRLNKLNQYITEQGATMLITAYPIGYGEFTPSPELYEEFQQQLQASLDCPVISDYTDYFFPYELFYDTTYHLTDEGAILRTQQLILDIQHWMDEQ